MYASLTCVSSFSSSFIPVSITFKQSELLREINSNLISGSTDKLFPLFIVYTCFLIPSFSLSTHFDNCQAGRYTDTERKVTLTLEERKKNSKKGLKKGRKVGSKKGRITKESRE